MKKITITMVMMTIALSVVAQSPQAFKYQAVARDNGGNILANQNISFRVSILTESITGSTVYQEIHSCITNEFGLVNLEIGNGSVDFGDFEDILWNNGLFFLKLEVDPSGGINFQLMGTTQLLSVPYSLSSSSLILTNENGDKYSVGIDNEGNLTTTLMIPTVWACGDTLIDDRDGKEYNTVFINDQCWMAENLNIGTMINGSTPQVDNDTIEKYCYSNNPSNCVTYGGLYQWNEMMGYISQPGIQGICPDGWHIPTEAEWCSLTTFIDPTVNCSATGWNGTDVGSKMKSTTGWDYGGNGTNTSGFTALPGGLRYDSPDWDGLGSMANFWTSTMSSSPYAWIRDLEANHLDFCRLALPKSCAISVRCMKN